MNDLSAMAARENFTDNPRPPKPYRARGYYLTIKEQWDMPEAFLTFRREYFGPTGNLIDQRIRVIIRSERLANLARRWGK